MAATEAAALAAAAVAGRGDPEAVDAAAVAAIRAALAGVALDGVVVIGEGEMDRAPMLRIGEPVGAGHGPAVDVAVDPVDGTDLAAAGMPGALSALAVAPRGALLHAPDMYMEKVAVGPRAAGRVRLDASPGDNVRAVAEALGRPPREVTVGVLDRPRHGALIAELRAAGARVRLIAAGDVAAAVATAAGSSGLDLLLGIGGAPEGVLAAAALRCLGGDFQGRLRPSDPGEAERARGMLGGRPDRLLRLTDLVGGGDVIFAATAVTSGLVLRGVRRVDGATRTHSVLAHASRGEVRVLETVHPRQA